MRSDQLQEVRSEKIPVAFFFRPECNGIDPICRHLQRRESQSIGKTKKNACRRSPILHDKPQGANIITGAAELYEYISPRYPDIKTRISETTYEADPRRLPLSVSAS